MWWLVGHRIAGSREGVGFIVIASSLEHEVRGEHWVLCCGLHEPTG